MTQLNKKDEKPKEILDWTKENHPTRESLVKDVESHKSTESRAYYKAMARLDIWDSNFGPKTEYVGYDGSDDPVVIKAAQEKEANYLANSIAWPTPEEQQKAFEEGHKVPENIQA